jgi:glutamyl-tRNA synthetase
MIKEMRTRFPPSPTGNMQIGNSRTALFCYLWAMKNKGKFFLRIEDTDVERSKDEYVTGIKEVLKYLGLQYEDHVLYQSKRWHIYKKYALDIYNRGFAYYCDCESLENCQCKDKNKNAGVLRFKVPDEGELSFEDTIYGRLSTNLKEIEDFALLRSDGTATYMLAVVVDDHETEITDVIRGEDHKNNTFKQILIYNSLGWDVPKFSHLPLIKGKDGKKLSKRKDDVTIKRYIEMGVLPEAMFNFLLRLGWGYKNEEIFDFKRALEVFDINDVKRSAATFYEEKLLYLSGYYMKEKSVEEVKKLIYNKHGVMVPDCIVPELTKRAKTLTELYENTEFLKSNKKDLLKDYIGLNLQEIEDHIKKLSKEEIANLRIELTGKNISPPLHFVIFSLCDIMKNESFSQKSYR